MAKRIEWDARFLDEYGDAFDVHHFATKAEAEREAADFSAYGAVAAVVERHDMHRDFLLGDVCASYTVHATFGSDNAIAAWRGEVDK